jgi:hypothetical protein
MRIRGIAECVSRMGALLGPVRLRNVHNLLYH